MNEIIKILMTLPCLKVYECIPSRAPEHLVLYTNIFAHFKEFVEERVKLQKRATNRMTEALD